MITKFAYIHVGSPSGVFNRIAYDCIGLAKEHRCDVVWEYEGKDIVLVVTPDSTLRSVSHSCYLAFLEADN